MVLSPRWSSETKHGSQHKNNSISHWAVFETEAAFHFFWLLWVSKEVSDVVLITKKLSGV